MNVQVQDKALDTFIDSSREAYEKRVERTGRSTRSQYGT